MTKMSNKQQIRFCNVISCDANFALLVWIFRFLFCFIKRFAPSSAIGRQSHVMFTHGTSTDLAVRPPRGPSPPEPLDGEVSIQCLRSSEFVLGKQTNFNGSVTIISCADASGPRGPENGQPSQEKIVFKDKIQSVTPKETPKGDGREWHQKLRRFAKDSKILLFLCLGYLVASAVALAIVLLVPSAKPQTGEEGQHRFYTKEDWGGKPPKSSVEIKLPVPYVVVCHTVTTSCLDFEACSLSIRNMQEYHMGRNFADIGYNFLVDSMGNIYEGRGWNKRNVHGGFVNGRNVDVALIGDFSGNIPPTEEMMDGLRYLLDLGLKNEKISPDYSLLADNSTYPTLSPGKKVYEIIQKWPHFDPDPESRVKDYYE